MTRLTDFSLQFISQYPWVVALAGILLIALCWWVYRRTTPSLATFMRMLLFGMRTLAVLIIIALLMQPILGFTRQSERKPQVAVLLDRSGSMQREEGGKSRKSRMDSLLSSETFSTLVSRSDLSRLYFGSNSSANESDIESASTALGDALKGVKQQEQRPDYLLLLTDGRSNSGDDPLAASEQLPPVLAVNLSLEESFVDLWIEQAQTNPVGFLNQPLRVNIRLGNQGVALAGTALPIKLSMRDGRRSLGEITLSIDNNSGQYIDTQLTVTPTELGRRLWEIEVSTVKGEVTALNNRKSLPVTVLKSRLSVLLVTSRLDHEIGFIRRTLLQQDKYEVVTNFTGQRSGNLGKNNVPTAEWSRFDAVIVHDPTPSELARYQESLVQLTSTKSTGLWIILGSRFGMETVPTTLRSFLPAYPSGTRARILSQESSGDPVESQLFHPTVRLAEFRSDIRKRWSELPPFQQIVLCDSLQQKSVVTLNTDASRGLVAPLFVTKRLGMGKLLQTNAQPFWRFDFARTNLGQINEDYERFLFGIIDWLTLPEEGEPIRFTPEKDLFTRGEAVRFRGTAYDPGFRPLEQIGGRVVLTPVDTSGTAEIDQPIVANADGSLQLSFQSVPPGDFRYRASIEQEGASLKNFSGTIRVESFSAEEYDQSGNPKLLAAIAQKSSGVALSAAEFSKILDAIPDRRITESSSGEFALWGKNWPLFLILGLLAAEWIGRKLLNLL